LTRPRHRFVDNPVKAMVYQLAENLHCTAAEIGQRVSVAELIDWLGWSKYSEARRDQQREIAKAKQRAERQNRSRRSGD
jgi:protein-L-isoaspartate O-methyltransferase